MPKCVLCGLTLDWPTWREVPENWLCAACRRDERMERPGTWFPPGDEPMAEDLGERKHSRWPECRDCDGCTDEPEDGELQEGEDHV